MFFFFQQKTAYEMRISDWSSDVCSSDLHVFKADLLAHLHIGAVQGADSQRPVEGELHVAGTRSLQAGGGNLLRQVRRGDDVLGQADVVVGQERQIGRASCRERVCQYV